MMDSTCAVVVYTTVIQQCLVGLNALQHGHLNKNIVKVSFYSIRQTLVIDTTQSFNAVL